MLSIADAFDMYDEDSNGAANMQELRAIMKALGQFPTEDELLEYLGGDPEAEIDLAAVTTALNSRGHTDAESIPGSPSWRRTRADSQQLANKFSAVGSGGDGNGNRGGMGALLRNRTKAMIMAKRWGAGSAGGDEGDARSSSRLENDSTEPNVELSNFSLAEISLDALTQILESVDKGKLLIENGAAGADTLTEDEIRAEKAKRIARLLSEDASRDLGRSPRPLFAQARPPVEDAATKQLLGEHFTSAGIVSFKTRLQLVHHACLPFISLMLTYRSFGKTRAAILITVQMCCCANRR